MTMFFLKLGAVGGILLIFKNQNLILVITEIRGDVYQFFKQYKDKYQNVFVILEYWNYE